MTVDSILDALAASAPEVRRLLAAERGAAGSADANPSGDRAIAADDAVDALLKESLGELDAVGAYASEEREHVVDCGRGYAVTVDPVDGSSNLRSNNPVGTVVGVYDAPLPARGTALVASAVLVYGAITTMVVARDGESRRYVVDDGHLVDDGQVVLPDDPDVFGVEGSADEWPEGARDLPHEHRLRLRYTGAMVADLMHVLDAGGLAWYPGEPSGTDGVLRLQYESNPVAHVVECAGGQATDGDGRLREREPDGLHERVPTAFGNPELVERTRRD